MIREIHDVYDVIMKIIITAYGAQFLNYFGIDVEIDEILSVEIPSLSGKKRILDFLCRLKDGSLLHIEFQFPKAYPQDKKRFFKYNITAELRYEGTTETIIINFTDSTPKDRIAIKIGESKKFLPKQFFIGDTDFNKILEKLIKKCEDNIKLTSNEEIGLMLMCLAVNCNNHFEKLKRITKLLQHENLFDKTKIGIIKIVIEIEIGKFITDDAERNRLIKKLGEIKMTEKEQKKFEYIIRQSNEKYTIEIKEEGRKEGVKEGRKEGKKEGIEEVLYRLLKIMTPEEITQKLEYPPETIKQAYENYKTI